MRIIKFRAWDKQDKVFVADNVVGNILYEIHANKHHDLNDGFILQQFTGLRDKNGKGIFEGDILSTTSNDNTKAFLEIVFSDGCFKAKPIYYIVFRPPTDWYICEIIGNIYENPELITNILKKG